MLKIIFTWMLFAGYITPMDEYNDGREMYVLILSDGGVVEHVYKEEVYRYIKEGEFEYDETYMYDAEKSRNCLCDND